MAWSYAVSKDFKIQIRGKLIRDSLCDAGGRNFHAYKTAPTPAAATSALDNRVPPAVLRTRVNESENNPLDCDV